MTRIRCLLGGLCALVLVGNQAAMASPDVVVSIKPLHSLVSAVMKGVGQPRLLIQGAETPHSFALKPSQARFLHEADAVFWVGQGLEGFLAKPLETLPRQAKVITFSKELKLLPYRREGMWAAKDDADGHEKHDHDHGHGEIDPHFWLDPVLVQSVVSIVVQTLSEVDGNNDTLYRRNGDALVDMLIALHLRTQAKLETVRAVPYLVFHDAYQYLEKRYRLNSIGTVTLNPEYRPGAKHLDAVRRRVRQTDVRCIFREPQFQPSMLNVVVADTAMRVAVLDPLGASLEPGPDAYFKIVDKLSESLLACLAERTG